ncbi:class I SAM-dependent methyltransferase [Pseudomonas sp. B2M1-30]|uniref:class I SAM-dependent methyltransferase n=1 Tax=Pseudomonas TaxID=286 RepID=UPI0021CA3FEB|nr:MULTISPECIES: class I SAM-dependent methyltransferase [Pseudomonas]MCU0117765.1 class I SAM-dependent methyltransferase [Pseudomonas sp. B2M1-30]MCU7259301.1 class I SAM-dependent methyltransferase [Pseudomonas koreensis]
MTAQQRVDRELLELGMRLRKNGYRFITPTPLTHERVMQRADRPLAKDQRDVFGWSMPFDKGLFSAEQFQALERAGILEQQGALWRSTVRWSSLNDLLFVHSAYPTSQSDAVFFGPDTYRFARVIEAHLQRRTVPVQRAVDIGCGAGVGAVLIARAQPEAQVVAVDINPHALRLSAVNAGLAGTDNIAIYHSDLLASVEGQFDLVVANPPYMNDQQQRAYRHGGGALGEALSVRIVREALPRLKAGGTLLLYTGVAMLHGADPFLAQVEALPGTDFSWTYEELDPDVFGEELLKPGYEQVERIAVTLLTVTRN